MMNQERGIAASLAAIEERLARIEGKLAALDTVTTAAPAFVGAMTDAVDTAAARLHDRGESPEAAVEEARALVDVLVRPKTLAALRQAIELSTELPKIVAAVVDTLDTHAAELTASGIDLDARRKGLTAALARLSEPKTVDALTRLLDSGLLGAPALEVVGALGRSLAEAAHAKRTSIGPVGLMLSLGDSDIKHALGFAVSLAKRFGAATREMNDLPRLATSKGESQ